MANPRMNILITGASSGLGAGMALEFAAQGHKLALCARRSERLLDLQRELIERHEVRVGIRALDVNDHAQVFTVFEDFAMALGSLDRVIVNAGVGEGRRIGLALELDWILYAPAAVVLGCQDELKPDITDYFLETT